MPTLDWIGKDKVINHHLDVPYRVLDKQYTYGADESANMIIHGDNLLALKSLLPKYEGKIDCVYIDPPYNTGNEGWIYNDNVDDPRIRKWLGEVVGTEGEDLSRDDKWLCMMYPRLKLIQKLMSKEGVIFVSIDDYEISNLRLICDEIFGKMNFVAVLHWKRKKQPSFLHGQVAGVMEYVLVYAKNKDLVGKLSLEGPSDSNTRVDNASNAAAERTIAAGVRVKLAGVNVIKAGVYKNKTMETEYLDDVHISNGRTTNSFRAIARFRDSQERIDKFCTEDCFFITKNYGFRRDKLEEEKLKRKAIVDLLLDWGDNQDSDIEMKALFDGKKPFDYPKPSKLISRLIQSYFKDDAIVLDSFAGSGTTGQAVLGLNKEFDTSRTFILIEMMDYAESITATRVKKVITGYGTNGDTIQGTGGDFTYYELGEPLLIDNEYLNEAVGTEKIREYIFFMETKEPISQSMVDDNAAYLGAKNGVGYYFNYDKDKTTTLDFAFLKSITQKFDGYIIYADKCVLSEKDLLRYNITFKKIPRDITRL